MSHKGSVSLLLSLLVLTILATPLVARDWIMPAGAHTPGAANTNWRTDLRIVNPSGTAADVKIDLLPQNTDNSARAQTTTVRVGALSQLSLGDVFATKFSFTGAGALYLSSSEPSLIITSRTYNEAQGGLTYGQFIPAVAVTDALQAGEQGHLVYVTKNNDYRTNIGFAGATATGGQVTIRLYDQNGLSLGIGTVQIQPYGQAQVDAFIATNSPSVDVARAVVTSTVPVVAYASVIDNRTGDPIALIAARESEASTLLAVPAVAHLPGAFNSLWRSDVRIFNPGTGFDDETTTITLTYYPGNVANPTPVVRNLTIGPNEVVALNDLLSTRFAIDNGGGGLKIQSDRKLLVAARTYNQSTSGTLGQDTPAVPYDKALSPSQTAVFSGLGGNGYRSNAGFFNLSATPLDLTLTLRGTDGATLGTKALHLDPNMWTQIDVFGSVGAANTSASLWVSGTGNGTYWAYVSTVDNASGDPVFVPAAISTAQPPPDNPGPGPGTGGDCVTLSFMRAGMVLGYRTSDGNYTSTQTVISDSATQTKLHDSATAGGYPEQIDSTFDYVVQGDLRAVTHMLSVASVQAGPFSVTTNTDITFSPALVISPLTTYCAGATFAIPATTQTVSITGPASMTQTTNRPAATGQILAVRESLTTAAGTFSTVKYRSTQGATNNGVAYSIGWYDIATSALVRQQEFDSNNNMVQQLDLTSIH